MSHSCQPSIRTGGTPVLHYAAGAVLFVRRKQRESLPARRLVCDAARVGRAPSPAAFELDVRADLPNQSGQRRQRPHPDRAILGAGARSARCRCRRLHPRRRISGCRSQRPASQSCGNSGADSPPPSREEHPERTHAACVWRFRLHPRPGHPGGRRRARPWPESASPTSMSIATSAGSQSRARKRCCRKRRSKPCAPSCSEYAGPA